MKKLGIFLLLCSSLLLACRKSDANIIHKAALPGTWKLVAMLTDPGNGSGTWKETPDTLLLSFTEDGRIESNAFPEARHYAITSDANVRFTFSDGSFINYNYALDNNLLVLSGGGCIEVCGLKFKR